MKLSQQTWVLQVLDHPVTKLALVFYVHHARSHSEQKTDRVWQISHRHLRTREEGSLPLYHAMVASAGPYPHERRYGVARFWHRVGRKPPPTFINGRVFCRRKGVDATIAKVNVRQVVMTHILRNRKLLLVGPFCNIEKKLESQPFSCPWYSHRPLLSVFAPCIMRGVWGGPPPILGAYFQQIQAERGRELGYCRVNFSTIL